MKIKLRSFGLVLLGLCVFSGVVCSEVAWSDSREVRDQIFEAIEHEADFGAYELEVEVRQGNVILLGTVASDEARNRLEKISVNIPGVKSVSNQVQVNSNLNLHSGPSSMELAERVRERVLAEQKLSSFELSVNAKGDRITLSGSVGSSEDAALIARIAASVPGVSDVSNKLVVSGNLRGSTKTSGSD